MARDYTKCDVCGDEMGPDKLHVVIDNGTAGGLARRHAGSWRSVAPLWWRVHARR